MRQATTLLVPSGTAEGIVPKRQSAADGFAVQVLVGEGALVWAAGADHRQRWMQLYDDCPWATAFQHPAFFDLWCRHYREQWSPVLIIGGNETNGIRGIMPLAIRGDVITGIGAHQAEYHGWLSSEADGAVFLQTVIETIARALPRKVLRLRYLPPSISTGLINELRRKHRRIVLRQHESHELLFEDDAISRSLKKSGNRKKQKHLARAGELRLREFDANGLEANLTRIAAMYDFRQGAVNGACPFSDDPRKAAFHLDWIRYAPHLLHASGLMIGDELVSALLLVRSHSDFHLAISAHAPELARSSPAKIHIYEVARALAREGHRALDLTPGGDPWKRRFSTCRRDVFELFLHRSLVDAELERAIDAAKASLRRLASIVGVDLAEVKRTGRALQRGVMAVCRGLVRSRMRNPTMVLNLGELPVPLRSPPVRVNDLETMLSHGPKLGSATRTDYLKQALERIAGGDRCYIVAGPEEPLGIAWASRKDGSVYDVTMAHNATLDSLCALLTAAAADIQSAERSVTVMFSAVPRPLRANLDALISRQKPLC